MSLYIVLKYLHVLVAIAWLGGAFGVILLGTLAVRHRETENVVTISRLTERLAKMIFLPASVIMLILGASMVWINWSFGDAWIVIGLIGVVSTGLIGGMVLTPLVQKIGETKDPEQALALGKKFYRSALGDQFLLWVIVWAMVAKPTWNNMTEIGIMALIAVVSAAAFIRR